MGRFVGVDALAAVGATGSVSFLILGFTQGLTTGFYCADGTTLRSRGPGGYAQKYAEGASHPVGDRDNRD